MTDSPKPPRSRSRSRTEVETDFSSMASPQKLSQKERDDKAARAAELRSSITDVTAEKAAQALATAGVAMQKSLSAVNEELTTRLAQLSTIKENIAIESEELERRYGAGVILEHLDVLLAQHDEKKQALADEIAAARAKWAEELAQQAKDRQRDADDFNYRTAQERKTNNDAWNEQLRLRGIAEQERVSALEKSWAAREEELKLREKELTDLRTAVAGHQAEIAKAVKAAESILENRLTKDHTHAMQLLEKDRASEKALAVSELAAKDQTIVRLQKLNEELQVALTEANKKNVEIATKALEASSDKAALAAVQNFAKDQSNGGSVKRS
jgi:hypothetical protein